jgi:predicted transcriptional regulator of viral defense system
VKIIPEAFLMMYEEKLKKLFSAYGGTITTAEANAVGIPNEGLRLLVSSGSLERVAHGVYISPGTFLDEMFILQKRLLQVIYSHDTALFLHDLSDRDPFRYTVTVPSDYEVKSLKESGAKVFYIKRELHGLGEIKKPTIFGNSVATYNMERTICDCVRSRKQMDIAIVTDALKRYVKRVDKDLNLLMSFAERFKISNILRSYLEVLL